MSNSAYPSASYSTPNGSDGNHPRTIAELAAIAQHNVWDPNRPLKHWLRTAEKARKVGNNHVDARDYEAAFIEFARAATIVLEKLPTHSEYHVLLNADQRTNLGMVSVISSRASSFIVGAQDTPLSVAWRLTCHVLIDLDVYRMGKTS